MRCAKCDFKRMDVGRTCRDTAETILRQRVCPVCGHKVFTLEVEMPPDAAQHTRTGTMKRLPGFLRVKFF
jgi:transcriptional regulator NrdR family protein